MVSRILIFVILDRRQEDKIFWTELGHSPNLMYMNLVPFKKGSLASFMLWFWRRDINTGCTSSLPNLT
jgi:hypothetical protein